MGRSQQLQAKSGKGDELTITAHTTDAPLLPVTQMQILFEMDRKYADFIVEQTGKEAEYRRSRILATNRLIYNERMAGIVAAFLIGIAGIGGCVYLGVNGQPALGGTLAALSLGTLALAFLGKKLAKEEAVSPEKKPAAQSKLPAAKSDRHAAKSIKEN